MIRLFLCLFVFAGGLFAFGQEATAQNAGDGDQSWCTVQLGSENPTICGFQSAHEACEKQKQSFGDPFNPDATMFPTEVGQLSGNCRWEPALLGAGTVSKRCNNGFVMNNDVCVEDEGLQRCDNCNHDGVDAKVGDPISIISGANIQSRTDFETADGRLSFSRTYHSRPYGKLKRFASPRVGLGANWLPSTDVEIRLWASFGVSRNIELATPRGSGFVFSTSTAGDFTPTHFGNRAPFGGGVDSWQLELVGSWPGLSDFANASRVLKLTGPDGTVYNIVTEKIDPNDVEFLRGRVHSVVYQGGYTQTYAYTAGGNLGSVTDSFGRSISFDYDLVTWQRVDGNGDTVDIRDRQGVLHPSRSYVITRASFPDGSKVEYEYNAVVPFNILWGVPERLIRATRTATDGTITDEQYHYEDARFRNAMTGVTDTKGIRYVTWSYDGILQAKSSELAGGVDHYDILYEKISANDRRRTVTNPLGKQTVYTLPGSMRIAAVNDQAGNGTPAASMSYGYSGVSVTSMTDKEGRQTNYSRDTIGRITSQTNAVGLPAQSTTTTEWHPQYSSPTRTEEPGLTTDYTYNVAGNLLDITQTDTSGAGADPRTWAFTYTGNGLNVASIDGPLPGASDTQTFTYAGANISSITNEIGHVTQITSHSAIGLPQIMVDPNGVTTRLEYDYDNRLNKITQDVGGTEAITSIQYDLVDNVTRVTPPNGAFLLFTYDGARRLTSITNAVGETITYGRNAMGGIVSTNITGADQAIVYHLTQTFDDLNRVIETVTTGPSITGFDYDKADNLVGAIDPRGGSWSQAFDGLNRVKSETDPLGATTDYGLNAQTDARNPLTSVTDARSAVTNYIRNGFGEVVREVNLEAGTTDYIRDERGLITKMTDARGIVTDYSYDAAGRPLSVSYPATPTENVNYTWDIPASGGSFGIGQLTSVSEEYGNTNYSYNALDQMISMTRTIAGQIYMTNYTYDLSGEVLTTTYPSGRIVKMVRDAAARIVRIDSKGAGETDFTVLIGNITYTAYGPMTGAQFGDGHNLSIAYDTAYRATNLSRTHSGGTALMNIGFGYDANGDILALNDNVRPERSQAFTYDAVSRLKTASGGYGAIGYAYNLGGDRTGRTINDGSTTEIEDYTYDASFRLDNVSSSLGTLRSFTYEASGQVATDDRAGEIYAYTNNNRGRPVLVTKDGVQVASYTYDDDEQRVVKSLPDGTLIHYAYDSEGRLISETNGTTGDTIREYIWLGLTPIAVFAANDNCDQDRIDELAVLIAGLSAQLNANQGERVSLKTRAARAQTQVDKLQSRMGGIDVRLERRTARLLVMRTRVSGYQSRLKTFNQALDLEIRAAGKYSRRARSLVRRIKRLQRRIANGQAALAPTKARIKALQQRRHLWADQQAAEASNLANAQVRLQVLAAEDSGLENQITIYKTELANLQTQCDAGDATPSLSYLHTDHLGKPQFATDTTGTVIWDAGGQVTPFGDGINTAAAFAQSLQFPGQYADTETGLSHNHHRTYDPALGRYLQSDPIGLAGGLNRYAYVGGNPVSFVDPTGEILPLLIGFAIWTTIDIGLQYISSGGNWGCVSLSRALITGAISTVPIGRAAYIWKARNISKTAKTANEAIRRRQSLKNKYRGGLFPNFRKKTLADFAGKSEAAIIASAGRTNLGVNIGVTTVGTDATLQNLTRNSANSCECK